MRILSLKAIGTRDASQKHSENYVKEVLGVFAYWSAALLLWELTICATIYTLKARLLYALAFTLSAAALLTLLSSLFKNPRTNAIVRYVLSALLFLLYSVQMVYYNVFDILLSLTVVSMGGEAVGNFLPTVIRAIGDSALQLVLFALPIPALVFLHRKGILSLRGLGLRGAAVSAAGAAVLYVLGMVPVWVTGDTGPGGVYRDPMSSIDRQAGFFGLLTAERLELGRLISGDGGRISSGMDLTAGGEGNDRNIIDEFNFNKLSSQTDDEQRQELCDYFSTLDGTPKNEYTGIFEGFNVVEICAESYSSYLLDPELTPTLYRLSREGFVFENFYNSFPSMTNNGEYCLCTGLMPDRNRVSLASSMDKYLPFCLGRELGREGAVSLAYHNNSATYYNRINTHGNMGYEFRAIGHGLDMEKGHPASDLEMFEKTVDEYIHEDRFAVHYMTYSGHAEYSFESNDMCIKNRQRVEDLDFSEPVKAYYACQLELEDAVSYLVQRLEQEGIADKTLIVLSGDHYPYGLPYEAFEELAGDAAADPYWRYRNSFICWSAAIETPIVIDDYCCSQDILPTVLNLLGVEYDSRLLTGRDVLSDCAHTALLFDGSFLTQAFNYDSTTGAVTWKQDQSAYPEDYSQKLISAETAQFTVAAAIMSSDYYRFAFEAAGIIYDDDGQQQHYDSFPDIEGSWYRQDVNDMVSRGALIGESGNFNGEERASKAAFLTMLSRILMLDERNLTEAPPFEDVTEDKWYYEVITCCWLAGIIPGGSSFGPEDDTSWEQAKEYVTAAAHWSGIPDAEAWADDACQEVMELAEQSGEDTSLPLTRGDAAALLNRLAAQRDLLFSE